MIALALSLVLAAEAPVCRDPCWVRCRTDHTECLRQCDDRAELARPRERKKTLKACREVCEYDNGACSQTCGDVPGCDLE
jgi:hypothetical protein